MPILYIGSTQLLLFTIAASCTLSSVELRSPGIVLKLYNMRFIQTAVGHRIESNSWKPLILKLDNCTVKRITNKGFLLIDVHEASGRADLTAIDGEIKRRLNLQRGPWDGSNNTLVLKCTRNCTITICGEPVGRKDDLIHGKGLKVRCRLMGAWADGYVWRAESVDIIPEE